MVNPITLQYSRVKKTEYQKKLKRDAKIVEQYFGCYFSINKIAQNFKISKYIVTRAIERYLNRPLETIVKQSKASDKQPVKRTYPVQIIIDLETGIFYHNAIDLSKSLNLRPRTVQSRISGHRNKKGKHDRYQRI